MTPLISCIMPTADRPEFVFDAIKCFDRQTYPNRELIILDNGTQPFVDKDSRIACADVAKDRPNYAPGIFYFRTQPKNIGALRNQAVGLSSGEYIAHWDDDDLSHPRRLEEQMQAMVRTQGALVGYHSMYFLNEEVQEAWLYSGAPRYAIGTSFFYRRSVALAHRFQDLHVGEDNLFLYAIPAETVWTCDAGDRMIARTHVLNTSPRPTNGPNNQYFRADYGIVANIAASYGIPSRRNAVGTPGSGPGGEPDSSGRAHRSKRSTVATS